MELTKPELFNYKASLPESKAEEVVEEIEIKENYTVLDIGSGGGYFAILFSKKAPKGNILCLDTQKEYLDYIKNKVNKENIQNIQTLHYDGQIFPIKEASVDVIFLRNVTHHIKNRKNYFQKIGKLLNENGKIAVVDYKRGKFFSLYGIGGHYV